jgi:hypothetical protein
VQAAAHLQPEPPHSLAKGGGTSHHPCGTIENRQEAVADAFHRPAEEAFDLFPYNIVVAIEQPPPVTISKRRSTFG